MPMNPPQSNSSRTRRVSVWMVKFCLCQVLAAGLALHIKFLHGPFREAHPDWAVEFLHLQGVSPPEQVYRCHGAGDVCAWARFSLPESELPAFLQATGMGNSPITEKEDPEYASCRLLMSELNDAIGTTFFDSQQPVEKAYRKDSRFSDYRIVLVSRQANPVAPGNLTVYLTTTYGANVP